MVITVIAHGLQTDGSSRLAVGVHDTPSHTHLFTWLIRCGWGSSGELLAASRPRTGLAQRWCVGWAGFLALDGKVEEDGREEREDLSTAKRSRPRPDHIGMHICSTLHCIQRCGRTGNCRLFASPRLGVWGLAGSTVEGRRTIFSEGGTPP